MSTPLKVVYFGTSRFAVPPLDALLSAPERFAVLAVVTQPDRPVGRKGEIAASPVALGARQHGLPLIQPAKLRRDEAALAQLRDYEADFFVVAAYGQILPTAVLKMPRFGCVNLHGSILPKYRGASPIQSAILAGETQTGVSLMAMDEAMDHGAVYDIAEVDIDMTDTFSTLEKKLAVVATKQLLHHLPLIADDTCRPQPQQHEAATYTKIINKEDGQIRWLGDSAAHIMRKLRAYEPWPGVFFLWQHDSLPLRIKIISASAIDGPISLTSEPGVVYRAPHGHPTVITADGCLELLVVQVEGKKPVDGRAFLNGHPDFIGARLE